MIVEIIFWIVVGLIVYVYLGYPLLLLIQSKLCGSLSITGLVIFNCRMFWELSNDVTIECNKNASGGTVIRHLGFSGKSGKLTFV